MTNRPLRILHITRTLAASAGGPPRSTARLAVAHAMLGHDVSLISGGPPADDPTVQDVLTAIPEIDRVTLLNPIRDRWSWRGSRNRALWNAVVQGYDVVAMHGFWRPIFSDAALACQKQGVSYILTPRGAVDPWSLQQKLWKKRLAMSIVFRRILNQSLFVHALTAYEAESVAALGTSARCEIIPNGVFMDEFVNPPAPSTFYDAFPDLQGRPFALFISRLHHKKGLNELIEAIAVLKHQSCSIDLVIAGPNEGMEPILRSRVQELGIQECIHFAGPLYGQMKSAALEASTCYCLPSKQEGFSMAVLEAMAAGVPVVITEACHFPEAITAGAGLECTTEPKSIAAALKKLMLDPEKAKQRGRAGRQLVAAEFTWPSIAQRSIETIRAHLARPI